MFKTVW